MKSYNKALYEYLIGFISEQRRDKFENYILNRTRYITVAVEDIYQTHNASAVLRSAECFGVQDVHIIENRNRYRPSADVAKGAEKWLSLHYHNQSENNTLACIQHLRNEGYRIVATTPHEKDQFIYDLDVRKGKIALFFGTEIEGISEEVRREADEFVKIPMFGFTESFNISVSAAICLYEIKQKLTEDLPWQLSEQEKEDILLTWVKQSVREPELLEEEFLKIYNPETAG
ncbi:MAG: RNA methyltransferase [Bacteroidia bacterium]|jgi:tRNA (guanosine-2'-O-)-methyltransferase|nr:RNA methyltransferase [Bacteroidia bacterium]